MDKAHGSYTPRTGKQHVGHFNMLSGIDSPASSQLSDATSSTPEFRRPKEALDYSQQNIDDSIEFIDSSQPNTEQSRTGEQHLGRFNFLSGISTPAGTQCSTATTPTPQLRRPQKPIASSQQSIDDSIENIGSSQPNTTYSMKPRAGISQMTAKIVEYNADKPEDWIRLKIIETSGFRVIKSKSCKGRLSSELFPGKKATFKSLKSAIDNGYIRLPQNGWLTMDKIKIAIQRDMNDICEVFTQGKTNYKKNFLPIQKNK